VSSLHLQYYITLKPSKISPENSQISSCDTVVANERYVLTCTGIIVEWSKHVEKFVVNEKQYIIIDIPYLPYWLKLTEQCTLYLRLYSTIPSCPIQRISNEPVGPELCYNHKIYMCCNCNSYIYLQFLWLTSASKRYGCDKSGLLERDAVRFLEPSTHEDEDTVILQYFGKH
jgi:hypothetical protein